MARLPRSSENGRQIVHVLAGAGALLLPYVAWWEAAITLAVAVAVNSYVLPKLAEAQLYRRAESTRGILSGEALYPAALLVLVLLFPGRPDIVAAAWGILAAGDGAATFVGRRFASPRVPWNREKSIAGTIAFVLAGSAAGIALAWWCRAAVVPPPFHWFAIVAPVAAAIAAAAAETISVRLHDNVIVTGSAALVLYWLSFVNTDMAVAQGAASLHRLPFTLAVNAAAAGAGFAIGIVSAGGALGGGIIGMIVLLTTGWRGWTLLCATLAAAAAATRLGVRRKTLLGIAEDRGGRRGAASAFANTAIAAAAAVLSTTSYASGPALVAFVSALAAGAADTVASEIGKAWGRRTYALTPPREVAAGTPGAVSFEGTVAGLVASLVLGGSGAALQLIPVGAIGAIVAGAFVGSLLESVLGGTLEAHGFVNNAMLNFFNTAAAVTVAIPLAGILT